MNLFLYIWDKGGLFMRDLFTGIKWKSILLALWRLMVVALVNVMVFLMLSAGGVEPVL